MGWRIYYQIGIKNAWFTGTEQSPFDSVFYSDFETFVFQVSINRAIV